MNFLRKNYQNEFCVFKYINLINPHKLVAKSKLEK